jgi:hypothetical protein
VQAWLQLFGGGFYLLNKMFLWFDERSSSQETALRLRAVAWAVYLVGLPPWVILFIGRHDWIAASVEASGAPAMALGLVNALRGTTKDPPKWLDYLARICIPIGFIYSLYDFKGISTFGQWLEIGLVLGFLVGTYLLANKKTQGYLWYVLMHITCGWLMLRQDYRWLAVQQGVSLIFIADAYRVAKLKLKQQR